MQTKAYSFSTLALLVLLVGTASIFAEDVILPEPLTLKQALSYAGQHPRSLTTESEQLYPRRQPLFLNCHNLAYGTTNAVDEQRNNPWSRLVAPDAAQQLEIMSRFFDVLLADLGFARDNESMAVAYVRFDRARARQELGQYSELQVAELETVYHENRQQLSASEASQQVTRSLLAQAINHPAVLLRDLTSPRLPRMSVPFPELDGILDYALRHNSWLTKLRERSDSAEQRLIGMELRQQLLELLLRLRVLTVGEERALRESAWRDLKLDQSRTLYEQEVKADLGYSMSQQTRAAMREQRVAYCQALTWAELNALQGKPIWSENAAGD